MSSKKAEACGYLATTQCFRETQTSKNNIVTTTKYHEIPRQQTHLEICLENYQLENEECFLQKFSNYSLFSVFYRLKLKILKVATLSSVFIWP